MKVKFEVISHSLYALLLPKHHFVVFISKKPPFLRQNTWHAPRRKILLSFGTAHTERKRSRNIHKCWRKKMSLTIKVRIFFSENIHPSSPPTDYKSQLFYVLWKCIFNEISRGDFYKLYFLEKVFFGVPKVTPKPHWLWVSYEWHFHITSYCLNTMLTIPRVIIAI